MIKPSISMTSHLMLKANSSLVGLPTACWFYPQLFLPPGMFFISPNSTCSSSLQPNSTASWSLPWSETEEFFFFLLISTASKFLVIYIHDYRVEASREGRQSQPQFIIMCTRTLHSGLCVHLGECSNVCWIKKKKKRIYIILNQPELVELCDQHVHIWMQL